MSVPTSASVTLRSVLAGRRAEIDAMLARYGAANPRLFGSVARGEATDSSDVDLLVDLIDGSGNHLLRVSGMSEEISDLLGIRVDVVSAQLLRDEVSATALADAVAL